MEEDKTWEENTPFTISDIRLLTQIVLFDNKEYYPGDNIPYPTNKPKIMRDFQVSMVWKEQDEFLQRNYDDVYKKQGTDWGWGYLWTNITTKLYVNENIDKLDIVAQGFINDFPIFLTNLEQSKQAVYHNEEYSPFKWLAWIKDDKVRLIHQNYRNDVATIMFDVLVDKDWFFHFTNSMIKTMKEYADSDLKRYQEYVINKYGKLTKDSIPYPENEPLNFINP